MKRWGKGSLLIEPHREYDLPEKVALDVIRRGVARAAPAATQPAVQVQVIEEAPRDRMMKRPRGRPRKIR